MSKGLLISRKQKEKLFTKKCKNPNYTNSEKYTLYNKLYTKLCRQAKFTYFKNKFSENEGNIRNTWATLREAMGTPKKCSSLPGYFKDKGKTLRDNFDIANGFNKFFSTIGSNLDN